MSDAALILKHYADLIRSRQEGLAIYSRLMRSIAAIGMGGAGDKLKAAYLAKFGNTDAFCALEMAVRLVSVHTSDSSEMWRISRHLLIDHKSLVAGRFAIALADLQNAACDEFEKLDGVLGEAVAGGMMRLELDPDEKEMLERLEREAAGHG